MGPDLKTFPRKVLCYNKENSPKCRVFFVINLSTFQSYELMKTEDIPDMQNSKFSTTVVKDVAQNILSFIKANAAKEGHTYWLYKGKTHDHNKSQIIIMKNYDNSF